ncbi:phage tail spike protein [Bacillus cereus]|uniref:phage tail spike protein n=1 Tax=Bacillus cereus TaxID=1396 RepID=UPI001C0CCC7B|nr:phage tail spike protein [Bacillus cereus]QWS00218.1 phage tail protein [Bacillus cereus]
MRTPSGVLHVIDFKTSQIVSAIQPKDYWDDKRHWEIKNNIDTLEFKVFDNTIYAATLMQQNLVLKEVRDGRIVPYIITEVEKDPNDKSIITYASGAWINLAKDDYIRPQKIEGKTVNEFMDIAFLGTKWKRGKTEYAGFHSMTIDEFIDPLSFLKKIASLFELEIIYRVEVVGSQIVGWYVDMVKKRGRETGKEVTLGKDLVGIKRIENSQNICTALIGFIKKEGGEVLTIADINKGMPYIVDNDAFQRWNEKGKHKFGFYTPETELDITPERLLTLMKTELAKRVNTSISYDVQAQSIGRVFGLAHELINEGDTIRIKDVGFTPRLYLEARAIVGDESHTDPSQDKYAFGDYREITDPNEELRKIYNRILSSLGSKQEMIDQLDKLVKDANETASNAKKESEAAKTLAEKVQENLKNNTVDIIEAKNPPTTGLKPYKTLWRDISNGKPGILKIWTGAAWESVVPDVESVKKETLEQVNKDIESAKTELNQKVQNVEGKAQEIAGQIVDVQKQVNNKVDQTWINNQLKDKADKTGVYTKDEIKDGFIGKQIYETDKQGNVQNFKDINTSIGQTNEALKQKAEKSELTKTNDGLTKLQNKTNEIETTANGTKQKLSELETTVNNTNVGGRNYVLESDKFILPPDTNQSFRFVNDLKDLQGKQVTLSVYVEIKNAKTGVNPSNRIGFEPSIRYSDNSIQHLGVWLRITDGMNFKGIISTTIWIKDIGILKTEQNAVYIQCGGDYVKVGRPKIEIGNKVTDWTPASEDNVSNTDFTKKAVEIETTIKGINTIVSNVQNEQGKLTERVTKSEQTADGFKTSIESLTKKDTEISNKLNIVEQTVEGTKKTISDVQQTTNDLKKTTTDIKEEAGKISTKLEQVEARTIGGENWLINTGPNNKPQTIGMVGGAQVNKAGFSFSEDYMIIECTDHTDSFYQFHLDNTKMGDYEKGKDMTLSIDLQNDVPIDLIVFQFINGVWTENLYNRFPVANWSRRSFTFKVDARATGWGLRLRFERNENSKGKKFRFKKAKLEKGSVPTDFSKSTYELEQSVGGVKTTVSKVQDSQVGFEKRMTTVEQTATGLSSTVSNLNNVVSDQGKKLTEANTKLEQQATAISAKVELKQVENYVAGFKIPELKQTVDKNKQDLLGELANKLATEQFNQKMTLIDNRFTINEQGINASAKKTEVYTKEQANGQFATSSYVRDMETRLQLTEKGVSISVKENDVIAAFNMSKENITLNANRINLVGFITANHIKGQVLEGVTLKTSGNRFVEINKQDMKIFDLDRPRGYIGFMETTDGSIQPSFVLGSDNRKYAGTGSFYIYQTTPRINGVEEPSKAWATLGISKGQNAEGTNIWSSYIQMQNDGGHLYTYAAGRLYFDNLNDIVFNSVGWARGYGKFIVTTTEPHYFKNDYGEFRFDRKSTGNSIYFANGVNDHDLNMGRLMLRASLVSGYDMNLQIKDVYGNGWRDVELRTLRAKENISATGRMWAQEFIPNSSRTLKTDIEDLPFSALDKINSVNIKQYHFIRDVERFESGESIILPINYGMIAEDSDDVFTTPQKGAVTLYSSVSISIQAIQEVDFKVKNLQFDHGMLKQEVDTLKEQLEAEKLEKVSMKAEIDELKVLVQQLLNK